MQVKLPSLRDILNEDSHDCATNNVFNCTSENLYSDNSLSYKNVNQWNLMTMNKDNLNKYPHEYSNDANNLSLLSSVSLNYTYKNHPILENLALPSNPSMIRLPSISTLPGISTLPEVYPSPIYNYVTPPSLINSLSPISSPKLENTKIKRRQRLGPSCDCCRKRKVKCDANIFVLLNNLLSFDYSNQFSASQWSDLCQGQQIIIDSYIYLVSFNKLIKFKSCSSCNLKNLSCVFSKGFTKDDLIKKKKVIAPIEDKNIAATKIVKKNIKAKQDLNLRKSSCLNCRKRKVKCVVTGGSGGCGGCEKKSITCEFK